MYKVEIICRAQQFDALRAAMNEIGVTAMTVYDVMGCGGRSQVKSYYRPEKASSLKRHIKIETVISEVSVDTLLDKIQQVLKVGDVGEGKVFVSEINAVLRVRTGERDYDALQ
jgi:nitrogen regulatory protein PII